MKVCNKCLKEIKEEMSFCPYCGEKQDSDDFLSNIDKSLNAQIESKVNLQNEQEKFKLFDYEKISDNAYIIKGLKNKYVYKIDIPEGVIAICAEAFMDSKVIEVKLPETLMEIEARAFKDCMHLKGINIPNSLRIIGDEGFLNCSQLNIEINENVDSGKNAFKGTLCKKNCLEPIINRKIENSIQYFGRYPQKKVTDLYLINSLKNIILTNQSGYIEFEGREYKEYKNNYYLVEPIKWRVLEITGNSYKMVSDIILDQEVFYNDVVNRRVNDKTIYPNNYKYSNIRAWLNGYNGNSYGIKDYNNKGFVNIAFNNKERSIILDSLIDNSIETTRFDKNEYVPDTTDKIFLLSYNEVVYKYFQTSNEKTAKMSDYAKDKGVSSNCGFGYYWLRTLLSDYPNYYVFHVNCDNWATMRYCNDSFIGVRPALEIRIK